MSANEGKEIWETRRLGTEALAAETDEGEMALIAAPPAYLGLRREEMTWAALAHASILLTLLLAVVSGGVIALLGPIAPALIWYTHRGKSDYVVDQARQATVFQLAGMVGLLVLALTGVVLMTLGWLVNAVLLMALVGIVLLPFMLLLTLLWAVAVVALPIAQVAYGCYAALEAYNGRPFRYRWIADLIDRYQAQV
ncbi:MAG TPA: DUF4870 domain-containing protein [Anaerolineae bacterium]|nr:DUF4870 domain-containing protein [Anaerolineae bacterium]